MGLSDGVYSYRTLLHTGFMRQGALITMSKTLAVGPNVATKWEWHCPINRLINSIDGGEVRTAREGDETSEDKINKLSAKV